MKTARLHVFLKFEPEVPEDLSGVHASSLSIFTAYREAIQELVGRQSNVKLEHHSAKQGCVELAVDVVVAANHLSDLTSAIAIIASGEKLVEIFATLVCQRFGTKSEIVARNQSAPSFSGIDEGEVSQPIDLFTKLVLNWQKWALRILLVGIIFAAFQISRFENETRFVRLEEKLAELQADANSKEAWIMPVAHPEDYTVIFLSKNNNGTTSLRSLNGRPVDAVIVDGSTLTKSSGN